jgi:glycosyltransferase involved in cell wall biosynthesis
VTVQIRVSVVVPTLRRPDQLRRCLAGLREQQRPPDEVVVVRRNDDSATADLLATTDEPSVIKVVVDRPGTIAALLAGARRATGDVVAITDDDAIARPEWLARLIAPYADPGVGGVGGRDVVHHGDEIEQGAETRVGLVTRMGRIIGAHHIGAGSLRPVDHLKGANMSFRRTALAFPEGLKGEGATVYHELATSLYASSRGWRLMYEPAAIVDHFPGPRFDEDMRGAPSVAAQRNAAFNQTYILLSLWPGLRWRRILYSLAIGDRAAPGLARAATAIVRREPNVARGVIWSVPVQLEAWRSARANPVVMRSLE